MTVSGRRIGLNGGMVEFKVPFSFINIRIFIRVERTEVNKTV